MSSLSTSVIASSGSPADTLLWMFVLLIPTVVALLASKLTEWVSNRPSRALIQPTTGDRPSRPSTTDQRAEDGPAGSTGHE